MATDTGITCPRCGERLPEGFTRCDACGAFLSPPAATPSAPSTTRAPRPPREPRAAAKARPAPASSPGVSGTAWIFLVAGLLCGGAIGYTLHGAVAPREEGGAPMGPADVMAGAQGGQGMPQGQMPQGQMPGEVVKMIGEYRQRLATNPNDVDANIGMGNLFFDSNQWEKAVDSYQKALSQTPGNADVRVDMAVALHNLGQNAKAKEEMERVTRENPTHRNAWLNLGVVSVEMGDRAAAIKAWEQYLKLEPNGPHSASIRAQIENMKRGS